MFLRKFGIFIAFHNRKRGENVIVMYHYMNSNKHIKTMFSKRYQVSKGQHDYKTMFKHIFWITMNYFSTSI